MHSVYKWCTTGLVLVSWDSHNLLIYVCAEAKWKLTLVQVTCNSGREARIVGEAITQ